MDEETLSEYATMFVVNELYKEIIELKRKVDFLEDQVLELQGELD